MVWCADGAGWGKEGAESLDHGSHFLVMIFSPRLSFVVPQFATFGDDDFWCLCWAMQREVEALQIIPAVKWLAALARS